MDKNMQEVGCQNGGRVTDKCTERHVNDSRTRLLRKTLKIETLMTTSKPYTLNPISGGSTTSISVGSQATSHDQKTEQGPHRRAHIFLHCLVYLRARDHHRTDSNGSRKGK